MSSQVGFFGPANQLASRVPHEREGAAWPRDRISAPAETGNDSNSFIGCVSS